MPYVDKPAKASLNSISVLLYARLPTQTLLTFAVDALWPSVGLALDDAIVRLNRRCVDV
jgi:hypothetical protein